MFGVLPEPQMGELIAELQGRGYDADVGVGMMTMAPAPEEDENGEVIIRGHQGEELGREDLSATPVWKSLYPETA